MACAPGAAEAEVGGGVVAPRARTASPPASAPRSCRGRPSTARRRRRTSSLSASPWLRLSPDDQQRGEVLGPFPHQAVQVLHAVGVGRLQAGARQRLRWTGASTRRGCVRARPDPCARRGGFRRPPPRIPIRPGRQARALRLAVGLRGEPADLHHRLLRQRLRAELRRRRPSARGSAARRTRWRRGRAAIADAPARTRGTRALVTGLRISANGAMRTPPLRVLVLAARYVNAAARQPDVTRARRRRRGRRRAARAAAGRRARAHRLSGLRRRWPASAARIAAASSLVTRPPGLPQLLST